MLSDVDSAYRFAPRVSYMAGWPALSNPDPVAEGLISWRDLPEPDPDFTGQIIDWYRTHGRSYPWREERDPFLTLCTEIFLQRTRAEQVLPVYEVFRSSCREPADVIRMGREWVNALFGRLGLRWRADYFWSLQHEVCEKHDGCVPRELDALLALSGVGRYAATATRVFAFGEQETVIDSNVLRILGRWYGIDFPDHARRSPRVARWAAAFAPDSSAESRAFNWGLIDFGASVCRPRGPRCDICCLRERCSYVMSENSA